MPLAGIFLPQVRGGATGIFSKSNVSFNPMMMRCFCRPIRSSRECRCNTLYWRLSHLQFFISKCDRVVRQFRFAPPSFRARSWFPLLPPTAAYPTSCSQIYMHTGWVDVGWASSRVRSSKIIKPSLNRNCTELFYLHWHCLMIAQSLSNVMGRYSNI